MLTQTQIESFHRDGYLAVRQVLTPGLLKRLQDTTDDLLEESRWVS